MQLTLRLTSQSSSGAILKKASSLQKCNRVGLRCYAQRNELVGEDFGARDAYAGELESNFSDKVLGNWDTEHLKKPPEKIGELVGLKVKNCVPCEPGMQPLEEIDVNRLRLQCPGWRVVKANDGKMTFQCDWKVVDAQAGDALMQRIKAVADAQGHHPTLRVTDDMRVEAELYTEVAGGLTENDFIIAAKINELEFRDLMPKRKPKFWA